MALAGEQDIMGNPWTGYCTVKGKKVTCTDTLWNGGAFNGASWSGASWSSKTWSSALLERRRVERPELGMSPTNFESMPLNQQGHRPFPAPELPNADRSIEGRLRWCVSRNGRTA